MWYLCQRGLQMLFILSLLSAGLFALLSAMPGNPVDLLITSNPNIKPEDVIRLKKLRGLDKPWYVQYTRWLWGYPEPARPPVILALDPLQSEENSFRVDLSKKIVDPNFFPKDASLKEWLREIWPEWEASPLAREIKFYIEEKNLSAFLLKIATHDLLLQTKMLKRIDEESAKGLSIVGLNGTKIEGREILFQGPTMKDAWFKVINSYGQEKVGHVRIKTVEEQKALLGEISPRLIEDETKPYSLDLKKFLVNSNGEGLKWRLIEGPGSLDEKGVYQHQFTQPGQSAVMIELSDGQGSNQQIGFDIEHGVIGQDEKFNRGFLFFFGGDKNALGFSQTYKRPVYELLFGEPILCGDARVDPGESCDDGNTRDEDGCNARCQLEQKSFLYKLDTAISGYILRSGRIGNTVQLMLPALLLSLLVAIPMGIFSAYRQYSKLDYTINFLAFIGISLPVFWFGIMMVYLFAEVFQLFPAGGVQTPGMTGSSTLVVVADRLKYAVLPTMVLSIFYVGRWLRYMRSSMLEVMPKDYIRTARAKGLSEFQVILKHAFRNALIPVLTVLAISIPALFGGAVLTETVFSWPGIGRLQYDAVMNSDYYVAIVVFLIAASLVMIGNLLADALYVLVDPRIRKE